MRLRIGVLCLGCLGVLTGAATAQGPQLPAQQPNLAEQVKIEGLQAIRRSDGNGIASFVLLNGTDKKIDALELTCWTDNDRERTTKVLVWANEPISSHASQQFKNVNVGTIGPNSRTECEVTRVD